MRGPATRLTLNYSYRFEDELRQSREDHEHATEILVAAEILRAYARTYFQSVIVRRRSAAALRLQTVWRSRLLGKARHARPTTGNTPQGSQKRRGTTSGSSTRSTTARSLALLQVPLSPRPGAPAPHADSMQP